MIKFLKYHFSVIVLLGIFSSDLSAQNPDIDLLRNINLHRNKSMDSGFELLTNTTFPLSAAIPLTLYGIGYFQNDSTLKQNGIMIATSVAASAIVFTGLKYAVNRQRPFETYSDIDNVTFEGTPSFPSGHTATAFSIATSLSLAYPEWYVVTPSYLWAGSVAYSRMHLGVHYPSDVLGGIVVGIGSAYLSYKMQDWLRKYF